MINKVILVGNLGRDPETRTTAGGTVVANLRIATTENRKDKDGNWNEHTEWHTIVLFGRNAENASRYLKKGRQVFVEGRIQTRKWQDKEGHDRYSTEIVADVIKFLGGRPSEGDGGGYAGGGSRDSGGGGEWGGGGGGGGGNGGGGGAGGAGGGGGGGVGGGDDDIPF